MIIYQNVSFESFNTLHISNTIRYMFQVENVNEIFILVYLFHYFEVPFYTIGNASKILFKNQVIKQPIVLIKNWSDIQFINNKIFVSSGTAIKKLIMEMAKRNKGGFESLYAIPASLGGLITMNAGDSKVCIGDYVEKVICLDKKANLHFFNHDKCQFSYRNSLFKNQQYIILYAYLKCVEKKKNEILKEVKSILEYRLASQDFLTYTCGSLFKNHENKKAYQLILDANAHQLKVGDACLSSKHANFLVNKKNATSEDVLQLIERIQHCVYEQFHYKLQLELNIFDEI